MGKRTTRAEECHPYATHRRFDRRGPEDDRRGSCWRAHSLSQFWLYGWRCELPGGRSACYHRRAARPRPYLSRSHQPTWCTPSRQHVISDVTIDGPKQKTSKSKLYRLTLNSTSDSHSTGTVSHMYSL